MNELSKVIVIVPCGRRKIWDNEPDHGPAQAADAYTSTFFKLNRAYAERFGDAWIVLSAKYGFIEPSLEIPGPYEVTFNDASTQPISFDALRRQVQSMNLERSTQVVGLGGAAYQDAITAAFATCPVQLIFPFAGLPIGRMMQATKQALQTGTSGFESGAEG